MSSTDNLTITKDTPLIECPHKLLELVDNMKIKDGESKLLKESLQVLHKRVFEKETKSLENELYIVKFMRAKYFYVDNCSIEDNDEKDRCLHISWSHKQNVAKISFDHYRLKECETVEDVCDFVLRNPHRWTYKVNLYELEYNGDDRMYHEVEEARSANMLRGEIEECRREEEERGFYVANQYNTIILDIKPVGATCEASFY